MRYFLDTEFIDSDAGTDLISLGMVAANGAEFYAVSSEYDRQAAESYPWLVEHVLGYLDRPGEPAPVKRAEIATGLAAFCDANGDGKRAEVWAWNGTYDFYLLAKLWGRLVDVPASVPTRFLDLKQKAWSLGNLTVPAQAADTHHALADARHDRDVYAWLNEAEIVQQHRRAERIRTKLLTAATTTLRDTPLR